MAEPTPGASPRHQELLVSTGELITDEVHPRRESLLENRIKKRLSSPTCSGGGASSDVLGDGFIDSDLKTASFKLPVCVPPEVREVK